jgi:fructose-bisphosphate aldolase class II
MASEGALEPFDQLLTDPDQAARFRRQTRRRCAGRRHRHLARRVQVLRASRTGDSPRHARDRGDPSSGCRSVHLVMHGSSSVPQALAGRVQRFMAARCARPTACRWRRSCAASAIGVRKVNIDTDLPARRDRCLSASVADTSFAVGVRPAQIPETRHGRDVGGLCRARFEAFGTAGQASKHQGRAALGHGQLCQRRARSGDRRREGGGGVN